MKTRRERRRKDRNEMNRKDNIERHNFLAMGEKYKAFF